MHTGHHMPALDITDHNYARNYQDHLKLFRLHWHTIDWHLYMSFFSGFYHKITLSILPLPPLFPLHLPVFCGPGSNLLGTFPALCHPDEWMIMDEPSKTLSKPPPMSYLGHGVS